MAKSLAQRLADFANPEPVDFDPEDIEKDHEDKSDSENEESRAHYVEVGKSALRSDGPEVDGEKYKGKRLSRRDLEQDDDLEDDLEEDDDEEDEEEDDEEEDDDASLDEEEEEQDDDEELDDEEDDDEEEDEEDESQEELSVESNGQVSQILKNEQKKLVSRLSVAAQQDVEKGKAVQAQMQQYEGLLDARIQLQKVLNITNILPEQAEDDGDATEALNALSSLASSIIHLRRKIAGEDGEKSTKKRSLEDYAEQTAELDEKLSAERDSVLTRWSRKVEMSSGSAAMQSSKFRSLNQSASVQVNSVLADMDRLVKRTRINRSQYKIPGLDEVPEEYDTIYDDTDFYRLLLKDLVDQRMADSANANGLKWTATKTKNKKGVDTKASKGRKLRYDIQEKVQGFDAPRNVFKWSETQAEELFSNLLGQSITMDDEEPSEAGDDDEVTVEEGFSLFA